MKNSSKLLNFNVNRDLKFKVFRGVDFNVRRNLAFNLNRDLFFDVNRDLGFGKRGVVFRGYVCPICGAPVAKDASDCDECGVQFEQTVTRKEKRTQKKTWDRGERQQAPPKKSAQKKKPPAKKKSPPKPPASKQRRSTFQCPVCGKLLYVGATKCPGCNVTFSTGQKIAAPKKPEYSAPVAEFCQNCNYNIPSTDKFCRRCGAPRPKGTGSATVSWQEFQAREKKDGLVSWDEYSGRN
ncbi:MAG: zinc ribbon domain-containing protein [Thermoplasmata archaeon]|nr:zinc ribbon domain-containing protein [Thermoplasmata archaeon]